MNTILDNPVAGVAVVVFAAILLFAPTLVARFRRLQAFQSISALNALTLLLVICFPVVAWFFLGLSPLQYWSQSPVVVWSTAVIWAAAAIWSVAGKQRDA